jgi:hypothetical protein
VRLEDLPPACGVLGERLLVPPRVVVVRRPAARLLVCALTVCVPFGELGRFAGGSALRRRDFRFPRSRRDTLLMSPASCFSTLFSRRLRDMSFVPP